ncbi:MAG: SUMF1/EgtB/PvdO family nonheme iron enzyme [Gemmatimonadetes bacterium]|nr:SUMF1/EgtB/PvdO family nonheme iron enzyme [Gemmatimonadota bacterium]
MIVTEPAGAVIWRAPFGDTTRWERLGVAGTDSVTLPRVRHYRLKLELPGYRTMRILASSRSTFRLDAVDSPHPGMVHVSDGEAPARLPGLDQLPSVRLGDFLIGRHEVTNREYRAFVLAGGYSDAKYWTEPFRRARRPLWRADAMALLVDRTGRPGPASWEGGDVPRGEEDLPVGGISWYEAAAYARWAGMALPTAYHWSRAADMALGYAIVPGSNLDGKGPRPGSTTVGTSAFGAFDMAGNVREWIENADADGKRYIFGGGWTDPVYSFNDAYARDPFDGERMSAFLFTPKRGTPPYQVVVHFPGDQNFAVRSMTEMASGNAVDFLVRSGRAVLYPVYKGVGDRSDSLLSSIPSGSIAYRDHVIMWGKDLRRALDFAESRPELDVSRTAYFGVSWGGLMGGLMPAIEPRIGAVVLFVAGLRMQRPRPEADPFNYLGRVQQPTLMRNATNDDYFPVETSQKPFFRRLGTRPSDKRYVLYEGGHVLPRTQLITESLAWLDKYLGPVR